MSLSQVDGMDAGRAALIALTSDEDFQSSTPLNHDPRLGPKVSGENDTPLGQRKTGEGAVSVKVESQSQSVNSMQEPQNVLLGGIVSTASLDTLVKTETPSLFANLLARKPSTGGGASAIPPFAAATHLTPQSHANSTSRITPAAHGHTLSHSHNSDPAAHTISASTGSQIGGSHVSLNIATNPDATAITAQAAKKDQAAWSRLVNPIRKTAKETQRSGKPRNGVNNAGTPT